MQATPEQRVEGRRKALIAKGVHPDEALIRAHEIEGVPLPEPVDDVDPQQEIEDLHYRHACEIRRADAATLRASRLVREVRVLRAIVGALPGGAVLLTRVRDAVDADEAERAKRARRRADRDS